MLPFFRDIAELANDEAGDGFEFFRGEIHVEEGFEIFKACEAFDQEGAVFEWRDVLEEVVFVVFVGDVTYDFLEEILQGDNAGGAAVFVNDDSHVDLVDFEVTQEVVRVLGGRDEVGLAEEGLEVETIGRKLCAIGGGQILDDVFGEKDANDVVDGVVIDRDAGIFLLVDEGDGFVKGGLEGEADDVHAVGHDVVDGFVVEFEDVVDHFLLVDFDSALLFANVDHHADFFFGDVFVFLMGVNAEEAHEEIAGEGQKPDKGIGQL